MFEQPWPDDIPSNCPRCGNKFNNAMNLEAGFGKIGRGLRILSGWMVIPWGIISFGIIIFSDVLLYGFNAALGVIGIFLAPPIIVYVLSRCMPLARRVKCFDCDFIHYYPLKKRKSR